MLKKLLLITLLNSLASLAQEHRILLYGKIHDNINVIANAHIINTSTKQGTFSDENGEFKIFSKINDSLKISSVGYTTKIWVVKPGSFSLSSNSIELIKTDYTLDEVILKKNLLNGILGLDFKQTPEDIAVVKSKNALDFSNINFKESVIKIIDQTERSKAPDSRKETDPTAKFAGIGGSAAIPDKSSIRLKQLRKKLDFKERFPQIILAEFSAKFFFEELKIPKEKYYHFLDYCNYRNIEELYKEGKTLEVITILQEESKKYVKTLK